MAMKPLTFRAFFCECAEKIVNIGMLGTDLGFLNDISVLISDIDCQLGLVLVDSEIQHWRSPWEKVRTGEKFSNYTLRETSVRSWRDYLLNII